MPSGDDIWNEAAFDAADLVFQRQFTLLQPLNLQSINDRGCLEGGNRRIQVAMLFLELRQQAAQLGFFSGFYG